MKIPAIRSLRTSWVRIMKSTSCDLPGLMSIDIAMQQISQQISKVTGIEQLHLENALGRVLAEDVFSAINVPGFDNSAMDGYAFKRQDLIDLQKLSLVGKSLAGHPYHSELGPGECIRIMTGAAIPAGADTVIMQENAIVDDNKISFTHIPSKGNEVRLSGESIRKGSLVAAAGKRLTATDIGLLSSLGCPLVSVYRKVKVAVFSTGDELLHSNQAYHSDKIYDGNRPAIKALLTNMGCEIIDFGIVADDKAQLREVFQQADIQADCVITSGGVSVGEADFVKQILTELGHIEFWKIAIKPGKPLAFGRLTNSVFFGLPGNPVSAFVTFEQIAAYGLRRLSGEREQAKPLIPAISVSRLKKRSGRTDFQRGRYYIDSKGILVVESTGAQGSGVFSSYSTSNCYIVLECDRKTVETGETVHIQMFSTNLL